MSTPLVWPAALIVLAQIASQPATVVELDAFSGRPNPRWEISDAAGLVAEALPHRSHAGYCRPAPDLGYRGVLIHDAPGTPGTARVFGGCVHIGKAAFLDPGRRLERRLLETATGEWRAFAAEIAAGLRYP